MKRERNPVATAFARGEQQRHQVHQDKRRDRRARRISDYDSDWEWDDDNG